MARRANQLAQRSSASLDVRVVFRDAPRPSVRPDLVYVFDAVPAEVVAALRLRVPLVLEAGDPIGSLLRNAGATRLRAAAHGLFEQAAWRVADALVLRGEGFRDVIAERGLSRRVDVLPEGVDLSMFRPLPPGPGRERLGLRDGDVAVGVVGSIVWSPVERTTYGWELVEALPRVDGRVKAVVVGEGTGLSKLRARAEELGVASRLITPGAVPHREVPELLAALDAASWTQTPDDVGLSRTTLKLPEYLACGTFVLASDVGEAGRAVDLNGERVPYVGGRDERYVNGIAAAIDAVAADPAAARRRGLTGVARARRYDWDRIAAGFVGVVERTLAAAR